MSHLTRTFERAAAKKRLRLALASEPRTGWPSPHHFPVAFLLSQGWKSGAGHFFPRPCQERCQPQRGLRGRGKRRQFCQGCAPLTVALGRSRPELPPPPSSPGGLGQPQVPRRGGQGTGKGSYANSGQAQLAIAAIARAAKEKKKIKGKGKEKKIKEKGKNETKSIPSSLPEPLLCLCPPADECLVLLWLGTQQFVPLELERSVKTELITA